MKAVTYSAFQIPPEIKNLPDPIPPAHGVVVRVMATGICRSDWHGWMGHDSDIRLPHVPGHELAGVVAEVGKEVKLWKKGTMDQEILAILEEVLSAGYVHVDAGTPQELYVWPYFFALPLDKLDAKQRVELFKIVTAGDFDDMKQFGAYIFYRVGITPAGQWTFFVAGD